MLSDASGDKKHFLAAQLWKDVAAPCAMLSADVSRFNRTLGWREGEISKLECSLHDAFFAKQGSQTLPAGGCLPLLGLFLGPLLRRLLHHIDHRGSYKLVLDNSLICAGFWALPLFCRSSHFLCRVLLSTLASLVLQSMLGVRLNSAMLTAHQQDLKSLLQ